jgi:regulator of sirC expression with transglutaminase-like and TPR domain
MDLDETLTALARDPTADFDVAAVALAVCKDEYPDLDIAAELASIDRLANQVSRRLRGNLARRIATLGEFLFDEMRFRGNIDDYYGAQNSYLNCVLKRRVGLPITLSILTMAVGTRAGLAIAGIGLPGHFIVKAVAGREELLFDPFHGGQTLDRTDCEALVRRVTGADFVATPEELRPISLGSLMRRLLTNLKGAYLRTKDFARAARVIARIRQLVPDDASEGRDLGVCLLQADRPGPAIDLLAGYLEQAEPGPDVEQVEQLLRRARSEVAKWN